MLKEQVLLLLNHSRVHAEETKSVLKEKMTQRGHLLLLDGVTSVQVLKKESWPADILLPLGVMLTLARSAPIYWDPKGLKKALCTKILLLSALCTDGS